jgi:ferredoxin-nitrite reductase
LIQVKKLYLKTDYSTFAEFIPAAPGKGRFMRGKSIEEIKKRKCGYDVWRDIERYAAEGYELVKEEDLELFKWYGIYEQRPSRGCFMVRVRIPGGWLNARQARCIAQAGRDFARGSLDVTTRQDIQFHWIALKNIPELISRLHSVGLSTRASCGDTPRNIVACPLAGRQKGEYIDVRPLVNQVNRQLEGKRIYANLPRKLKISICGCPSQCTLPQLHDVSFYAVKKKRGTKIFHGFNILVGGGLSARPFMGVPLDVFITEDMVAETCEAICRIFAEKGPRESRQTARMKFMVHKWSAPRLRDELAGVLGRALEQAPPSRLQNCFFRDPILTGQQKQRGLHYIATACTAGRLSPEDLFVAAGVAEEFGSGALSLTTMQNILVTDIPGSKIDEACERLSLTPTLQVNASHARIGVISCTGFEYCEKALVETKELAASCVDNLEKGRVDPAVPLKIAFSGCSNDCAHAQAADIGLMGTQNKEADSAMDYFHIIAGTRIGDKPEKGIKFPAPIPANRVAAQLASLIRGFNEKRRSSESFPDFYRRYFTEDGIEFQI